MIKFKEFELDCDRYELRRNGRAVKLEKMPMELLILLAAKKGRLVTRPEIIECLWGSEVFVDSEHGINTAIRKLRLALRDDPEKPCFVETVTGKGYRFIAPAIDVDEPAAERNAENIGSLNGTVVLPATVAAGMQKAESDRTGQAVQPHPKSNRTRYRSLLFVAAGSLAALGMMAIAISWIRFD